MITPNPALAGIRAKIERAEKHIRDFDAASKRFVDAQPYSFTHEVDDQTRVVKILIKNIADPPPELSVIVGDVIHNLRSSLDHLFCQLVRLRFPSFECVGRDLYFPIGESPQGLETILKKGEIKKAGIVVLKAIKRLESYKGGKRGELWQIHQLSLKDKHRLPIVAAASIDRFLAKTTVRQASIPLSPQREFEFAAKVPEGAFYIFKPGDVVLGINQAELLPVSEAGELQTHIQFRGEVVFNEPRIVEIKPVHETLVRFVVVVKDTVQQLLLFFP